MKSNHIVLAFLLDQEAHRGKNRVTGSSGFAAGPAGCRIQFPVQASLSPPCNHLGPFHQHLDIMDYDAKGTVYINNIYIWHDITIRQYITTCVWDVWYMDVSTWINMKHTAKEPIEWGKLWLALINHRILGYVQTSPFGQVLHACLSLWRHPDNPMLKIVANFVAWHHCRQLAQGRKCLSSCQVFPEKCVSETKPRFAGNFSQLMF